MSLVSRELQDVWRSLRASGVERRFGLYDVRIRNLRGIRDLRITFDYPVSVLAGPNGCGKSTVLFACACAYRVPGRGPWEFAPATLFPHFAGGASAPPLRPGRPHGAGVLLPPRRRAPVDGVAPQQVLDAQLHGSAGRPAAAAAALSAPVRG